MSEYFKYFKQADIFPAIARVITARHLVVGDFVRHRDIAIALSEDSLADPIFRRAVARGWGRDRQALASNMVAWFSQQITHLGSNSDWAAYFKRKKIAGRWAYRPITADEIFGRDVDASAIEGEFRLVNHLRRERDRGIVDAKKEETLLRTGRLQCQACGFDFRESYPGLGIDFCEVHHNRPFSESNSPVVIRLEDLSLLCSNCHRMIHRTKPLKSVKRFRELLPRAG